MVECFHGFLHKVAPKMKNVANNVWTIFSLLLST
jgi:hypothetical protein